MRDEHIGFEFSDDPSHADSEIAFQKTNPIEEITVVTLERLAQTALIELTLIDNVVAKENDL